MPYVRHKWDMFDIVMMFWNLPNTMLRWIKKNVVDDANIEICAQFGMRNRILYLWNVQASEQILILFSSQYGENIFYTDKRVDRMCTYVFVWVIKDKHR